MSYFNFFCYLCTMIRTEVLIVGAGPAGSVCGSLLLKRGVDCLVVDRATFPRDKICGGGLTPKAWRLLEQLLPDLRYDYRAVTHMKLQFENDAPCEFEAGIELRMTNRKDFDHTLVQYYLSHGGKMMKAGFQSFEQQNDGTIVATFRSGEQVCCRYLVAADGANSLVRRQMFGVSELNALFMEQYVEQQADNEIFVHFSKRYAPGCFYKFPGVGRDIYGFRGPETNRETFAQVLKEFGIAETRFVGAYIPLETVSSTIENVILIGDAGGFANKMTGEGLYDCFKTAYNAVVAIVEKKPFAETNREVFKKMRREDKLFHKFFSDKGFRLFRRILHYPRLVRWVFDAKMKRESFLPAS